MSTLLAVSRPTDWNFPLFVHLVGVVLLVGGLVTAAALLGYARGDSRSLRLGYWSLVALALPGWIIMRIGGQWVASKGWDDVEPEPDWLGLGWLISELGGLLLLVTLIVGGIGVRRHEDGRDSRVLTVTLWLALVLLAANLVAVWAMAGKPG